MEVNSCVDHDPRAEGLILWVSMIRERGIDRLSAESDEVSHLEAAAFAMQWKLPTGKKNWGNHVNNHRIHNYKELVMQQTGTFGCVPVRRQGYKTRLPFLVKSFGMELQVHSATSRTWQVIIPLGIHDYLRRAFSPRWHEHQSQGKTFLGAVVICMAPRASAMHGRVVNLQSLQLF
jgi:hypothetical protein